MQGISNVVHAEALNAVADLMFWGLKAGITPLRTLFQLAEAVGAVRMLLCPLSPNICRRVGAPQPFLAEACMLVLTKECVDLQNVWHRQKQPLRMLHMHAAWEEESMMGVGAPSPALGRCGSLCQSPWTAAPLRSGMDL